MFLARCGSERGIGRLCSCQELSRQPASAVAKIFWVWSGMRRTLRRATYEQLADRPVPGHSHQSGNAGADGVHVTAAPIEASQLAEQVSCHILGVDPRTAADQSARESTQCPAAYPTRKRSPPIKTPLLQLARVTYSQVSLYARAVVRRYRSVCPWPD